MFPQKPNKKTKYLCGHLGIKDSCYQKELHVIPLTVQRDFANSIELLTILSIN